jgi:two-component system sensor histidine kinase KdpD
MFRSNNIETPYIPKNNDQFTPNMGIKICILVFIMIACTIISMFFFRVNMFESNIVMIYLLGILFVSYLAEGYIYSLLASICAVLLYNFFFTEPYYTLKVNDPNYLVTFPIMFIVGFITSMLTNRIKLERQLVEEREQYITALYDIEKKLLNVKSREDLAKTSAEEIAGHFNASVIVKFYDSSGIVINEYMKGENVFDEETERYACLEAYQSGNSCGHGTTLFAKANGYYSPIFSQFGTLGVIGIALAGGVRITSTQRTFLEVISPQIAVVLQREKNYEKQQKTQIEMQEERLRADMLRSISHDFRTPLAGVMGLASTALDNYDKMNDEVKKNFLQSIYEDADWLNEIVENILQTTRFDEGKIKLNLEEEAAEEIITEAVTHVKKHAHGHRISVQIPDEIILIQADGVLLRQVLVNILNNAVSYSPAESEITVSLYRKNHQVVFEIKDKGPGIAPDELTHVFERYHRNKYISTNRKGIGLGLSLCKSIVEAHNGEITVENDVPHGTIVRFCIGTTEVE